MWTYLTARLREPTSGAVLIYAAAIIVFVTLGWFHGGGWNLDVLVTAIGAVLVAVLTPEAVAVANTAIDDLKAAVTALEAKIVAALPPTPAPEPATPVEAPATAAPPAQECV